MDSLSPLLRRRITGNNRRVGKTASYRLKLSVSAADNEKLFTVDCSAFNKSTNREELTIQILEWFIAL